MIAARLSPGAISDSSSSHPRLSRLLITANLWPVPRQKNSDGAASLILPRVDRTEPARIIPPRAGSQKTESRRKRGPVAGSVGIEGGVVSGVINLESLG
jgi:hypothetical protein